MNNIFAVILIQMIQSGHIFACAKMWPYWIIRIKITATRILTRCGLWAHEWDEPHVRSSASWLLSLTLVCHTCSPAQLCNGIAIATWPSEESANSTVSAIIANDPGHIHGHVHVRNTEVVTQGLYSHGLNHVAAVTASRRWISANWAALTLCLWR